MFLFHYNVIAYDCSDLLKPLPMPFFMTEFGIVGIVEMYRCLVAIQGVKHCDEFFLYTVAKSLIKARNPDNCDELSV